MRHALASLCLLASAALIACGSTSTTNSAGGGASGGGGNSSAAAGGSVAAVLKGTFTISGPYAGSGTFSTKPNAGVSCSDLAQHGDSGIASSQGHTPALSVGTGTSSVTIAGHTINFDAGVSDYHGPGDYDNSAPPTTAAAATATAEVRVDDGNTADFSSPDASAPVKLTVHSDGSGTGTFTGLADMNGGSGTLSGSATWTCSS